MAETDSKASMGELEVQLEMRDSNIANLRKMLDQKDELLMITSEKLKDTENRLSEMEEALVKLTKESPGPETAETEEVDNFVASNSRAAQLEVENSDLRLRLVTLANKVTTFVSSVTSADFRENVEALEEAVKVAGVPDASGGPSISENEAVHLQVKMELEHERRLRTQAALDEAERRQVALKRDLDSKSRECGVLENRLSDLKDKSEAKLKQVAEENKRLEKLLKVKEAQICESENRAKELSMRAEEFEELFNGQLSTVKALQSDLAVASNENKALVKEMEMLNQMFNAMERQYVSQASSDYKLRQIQAYNAHGQETAPKDANGKEIAVQDVLNAVAKTHEAGLSALLDSDACFKEMTTRNGTRMVLSVSKTFMKLKDLIMEKKTLEDQLEKMKAINDHLHTRVNSHEEKLYNITDELNKTWTFVSTLKQQHRQLHESEQILRAELTEKRHLLAKLREELEYSRESWKVVKKKTADSEKEWHALRAEFAARRKMFKAFAESSSASESGFSTDNNRDDNDLEDREEGIEKSEAGKVEEVVQELPQEEKKVSAEGSKDDLMTASTDTITDDDTSHSGNDDSKPEDNGRLPVDPDLGPSLVFIPSLDFMTNVPSKLMPPLFPRPQNSLEVEQYSELYHKLMASTARSAALANRLAEMHRSTTDSGNGLNIDEEDYEPQTEEDSIVGAPSPDLESEVLEDENERGAEENNESSSDEEELEDLGLSNEAIEQALAASGRNYEDSSEDEEDESTTSMSSAVESEDSDAASELAMFQSLPPPPQPLSLQLHQGEVVEELATPTTEPDNLTSIPSPPPQPTFSLVPPPATVTVRPTFNYANIDSADSSEGSEDEDGADNEEASENATAVTRFLIKHLPKQLAKLRHDKGELEDRIRDLEALISQQNVAMTEMERRTDVYRKEAETARKWSSSLANLHHVKVNTSQAKFKASASASSSLSQEQQSHHECTGEVEGNDPELIELPINVTHEGVSLKWTVLIQPPSDIEAVEAEVTEASVFYRESSRSPSTTSDYHDDELLTSFTLQTNVKTPVEVSASRRGLYVLKLKASRLCLSDINYEVTMVQHKES